MYTTLLYVPDLSPFSSFSYVHWYTVHTSIVQRQAVRENTSGSVCVALTRPLLRLIHNSIYIIIYFVIENDF